MTLKWLPHFPSERSQLPALILWSCHVIQFSTWTQNEAVTSVKHLSAEDKMCYLTQKGMGQWTTAQQFWGFWKLQNETAVLKRNKIWHKTMNQTVFLFWNISKNVMWWTLQFTRPVLNNVTPDTNMENLHRIFSEWEQRCLILLGCTLHCMSITYECNTF
jgi:hypothetical protein